MHRRILEPGDAQLSFAVERMPYPLLGAQGFAPLTEWVNYPVHH